MQHQTPIHLVLSSLFLFSAFLVAETSPSPSPEDVVARLYKAHDGKQSPFFQTKDRERLNRYFAEPLAKLIWKDAVTSKGEVGAFDFDPLYDAQDTQIKKFVLRGSQPQKGRAEVIASFENMGKKVAVTYRMVQTPAGWRISDIIYAKGRSLLAILGGK